MREISKNDSGEHWKLSQAVVMAEGEPQAAWGCPNTWSQDREARALGARHADPGWLASFTTWGLEADGQ